MQLLRKFLGCDQGAKQIKLIYRKADLSDRNDLNPQNCYHSKEIASSFKIISHFFVTMFTIIFCLEVGEQRLLRPGEAR